MDGFQATRSSNMTNQAFPPPPLFGFSKDDNINLEDIFTDWFTEDVNNSTAPNNSIPSHAPATAPPSVPQGSAGGYVAMGGYPPQQLQLQQQSYVVQQPQPAYQMVGPQGGAVPVPQQQQRMPSPMVTPYVQIQPMPQQAAAPPQVLQQQQQQHHATKNRAMVGGAYEANPTMTSMQGSHSGDDMGGDYDDYDDDDYDDEGSGTRKKRARGGSSGGGGGTHGRRMTEEQKVERRERNREHAKRSRVRKKFLLESLQKSVNALQEENDKLRQAIRSHLKESAESLLKTCEVEPEDSLITSDPDSATKILDDPDYTLVKALQTAQQNFVITDPTLPDNPIVYASGGFLSLTGYQMDQILGRNCRFLQGPDTDPASVDKIRRAIEEGVDGSVCLLNYKADGTTFWNQFFIAALRGADGNIVNYVGVQCKVSEDYAREVLKKEAQQSDIIMTTSQAGGGGGSGGPATRSAAKREGAN